LPSVSVLATNRIPGLAAPPEQAVGNSYSTLSNCSAVSVRSVLPLIFTSNSISLCIVTLPRHSADCPREYRVSSAGRPTPAHISRATGGRRRPPVGTIDRTSCSQLSPVQGCRVHTLCRNQNLSSSATAMMIFCGSTDKDVWHVRVGNSTSARGLGFVGSRRSYFRNLVYRGRE